MFTKLINAHARVITLLVKRQAHLTWVLSKIQSLGLPTDVTAGTALLLQLQDSKLMNEKLISFIQEHGEATIAIGLGVALVKQSEIVISEALEILEKEEYQLLFAGLGLDSFATNPDVPH